MLGFPFLGFDYFYIYFAPDFPFKLLADGFVFVGELFIVFRCSTLVCF